MDLISATQLLGNVGEFFGAIAVVATLGYLAVQVRQNTRSTNSNNNHNLMIALNSFNETLFSQSELARIFYHGIASPEDMAVPERYQFVHMFVCLANIYRNLYFQFVDGAYSEAQWLIQAREAKQLMETPGGIYTRSVSTSYEDLFKYLETLPGEEARPLSEDYFPSRALVGGRPR